MVFNCKHQCASMCMKSKGARTLCIFRSVFVAVYSPPAYCTRALDLLLLLLLLHVHLLGLLVVLLVVLLLHVVPVTILMLTAVARERFVSYLLVRVNTRGMRTNADRT